MTHLLKIYFLQMMYGRSESWRGDSYERRHNHGYGDPRRSLPVSSNPALIFPSYLQCQSWDPMLDYEMTFSCVVTQCHQNQVMYGSVSSKYLLFNSKTLISHN